MEPIFLVNKQDLIDAFREVLKEVLSERQEGENVLNIAEAVEYLNNKGYKVTKSTLYSHTSKKQIKFDRFGDRKIVFKVDYLDEFIRSKICK
jgi:hypothetical protein